MSVRTATFTCSRDDVLRPSTLWSVCVYCAVEIGHHGSSPPTSVRRSKQSGIVPMFLSELSRQRSRSNGVPFDLDKGGTLTHSLNIQHPYRYPRESRSGTFFCFRLSGARRVMMAPTGSNGFVL